MIFGQPKMAFFLIMHLVEHWYKIILTKWQQMKYIFRRKKEKFRNNTIKMWMKLLFTIQTLWFINVVVAYFLAELWTVLIMSNCLSLTILCFINYKLITTATIAKKKKSSIIIFSWNVNVTQICGLGFQKHTKYFRALDELK